MDNPPASAREGTPPAAPTGAAPEASPAGPESFPPWLAVSRGVALFFGAFALVNVLGELRQAGFDANLWWIDLRPLPQPAARGLLAVAGTLLVMFGVLPRPVDRLRQATRIAAAALFAVALWNAWHYYELLRRGEIAGGPVPLSLHVAASLAVVLVGLGVDPDERELARRDLAISAATVAFCTVLFPLAQMYCFGKTDYRRDADAVVVFGCRAYADGRPSDALRDRVLTACELYEQGLAETLILSGGPGDGDTHETDAMRNLAVSEGVAEADIVIDRDGLDTQDTIDHAAELVRENEWPRLLAVSHFYHLPRIKLTARRAGIDVYTVPAEEPARLEGLERNLLREVAALWAYYLRPLTR